MGVDLRLGDCLEVLRTLPDCLVDSVVTDPPAGIAFMNREWDDFRRARNPADAGRDDVFGRSSAHGPEYGRGAREAFIAFIRDVMAECLRVLKPGGHALVWAIPRTSHWAATAVEDAGFEIRDVITHHFGNGFPKSLDVSKAIDRAAGQRGAEGHNMRVDGGVGTASYRATIDPREYVRLEPITDAAHQWQGWGTALKPASEHWILARRPLDGTVAANVLKHGVGGLNIDGCRASTGSEVLGMPQSDPANRRVVGVLPGATKSAEDMAAAQAASIMRTNSLGRWPANLVLSHDGCAAECVEGCPVKELDRQSGESQSGESQSGAQMGTGGIWSPSSGKPCAAQYGDSGGAARFFYCAKPSRYERDLGLDALPARTGGEATDREDGSAGLSSPRAGAGRTGGVRNGHPTVKSIDLMRWLCRLITPPGGTVLDCFLGSGSTGCAAVFEGFNFIGIERESEYMEIARRRIEFWAKCAEHGIDPREAERGENVPEQQLDLFGAKP